MRYSRRSVLFAVTLIAWCLGAVIGRVEYLRRWAVFHERAAALENARGDMYWIVGDEAKGYRQFNEVKAEEYRAAMWRPWTVVEEPALKETF